LVLEELFGSALAIAMIDVLEDPSDAASPVSWTLKTRFVSGLVGVVFRRCLQELKHPIIVSIGFQEYQVRAISYKDISRVARQCVTANFRFVW
jgi:hypothetical protein